MKAQKTIVLMISLLVPAFWQTAPAAASPQGSSLQQERDTRIRARAVDYKARLDVLYDQQLAAWSASFVERRRAAIQRAGEALAAKAAAVRTARPGSWSEVGKDPEFLAFERQQIALLLEPQQIRRELTSWAGEVENQTRNEMIEFFRQLIAEDLGMVFDRRLRGRVVQAVQAIPVETLVVADAGQIEAWIHSALPTSILTRHQRASISAAASALAFAAGPMLATAAGMPALSREVAGLSALLAQWLTSQGLEMLDRSMSGEPSPAALSRQIGMGLQDWQARHLEGRLREILDRFGQQVMDTLENEARRINLEEDER